LIYPELSSSSKEFPIYIRLIGSIGDTTVFAETNGIILAAPPLFTDSDFNPEQFIG
jgi:hypothetical protein